MGIVPTGEVLVYARIGNLKDVYDADKGRLRNDQIRSLALDDALVDTGATILSLPRRYVQQLGLNRHQTRTAGTTAVVVSLGSGQPAGVSESSSREAKPRRSTCLA